MSAKLFSLLTMTCWCLLNSSGFAQDADQKTDEQPAATTEADKAPADPLKEWDSQTTRRKEIATRLREIRSEFGAAKELADKKKLRDEFNNLQDEFKTKVLPQLNTLLSEVLKARPQDVFANEMAMIRAFDENRYQAASQHADVVMAAGDVSVQTMNMAGVSKFAQHQFADAAKILEKAKGADPQAEHYIKAATDYIEFWKKEQELRQQEEAAEGEKRLPRVELETTRGKIELLLFEDQAPNAVANFIELIESKKYDGTKFHRVIPNFMAQGGTVNDGEGPGYTIKCECYSDDARMHFAGTLSMAHAGRDTGGSQFFITHLPTSHLNGKHTAFGRVLKGMDVVASIKQKDELKSAKVLFKRPHEYKAEKVPNKE